MAIFKIESKEKCADGTIDVLTFETDNPLRAAEWFNACSRGQAVFETSCYFKGELMLVAAKDKAAKREGFVSLPELLHSIAARLSTAPKHPEG